jgi:type III secretion protein T
VDIVTYNDLIGLLETLAFTQPRILAMLIAIPVFNQSLIPGFLKLSISAALGLLMVPVFFGEVSGHAFSLPMLIAIIAKEGLVGFMIGFMIALPFWMFEAVGFLIDNQRGASIAATLNPLTGNDSSPLGELMNQAFIVFFLISGGFLLMLGILYESYAQWGIFSWFPNFRPDSIPAWLAQLDQVVRVALLLGAPAIVAMFLSEVGLALVSGFVPSLQVFFLAMPIKCGVAFLVLVLYVRTMFEYGVQYIDQLRDVLPFLSERLR